MWTPLLALILAGPAQAQPILAVTDEIVPAVLIPHEATATVAPDGTFTLVLLPEQPWTVAEVRVRGAGAVLLGAADGSSPVEVSGVLDQVGALHVTMMTVSPDSHGVSWSFSVDPELLPVSSPTVATTNPPRRGFWPWQWGRQ